MAINHQYNPPRKGHLRLKRVIIVDWCRFSDTSGQGQEMSRIQADIQNPVTAAHHFNMLQHISAFQTRQKVGLCECDRGWYGGPEVCWDQGPGLFNRLPQVAARISESFWLKNVNCWKDRNWCSRHCSRRSQVQSGSVKFNQVAVYEIVTWWEFYFSVYVFFVFLFEASTSAAVLASQNGWYRTADIPGPCRNADDF